MVYGFVVHSLLPGTCRVFYSCVFHGESQEIAPESRREDRKEKFLHVANRVQSEYSFRRAILDSPSDTQMQNVQNTDISQLMESGVIRLPTGCPFSTVKTVLWKGYLNCGLSLICEKDENTVLAEHVLSLTAKYLHKECHVLENPSEALLKADRITAVLNQFLSSGQLLYMTHRVERQFERELELRLKS